MPKAKVSQQTGPVVAAQKGVIGKKSAVTAAAATVKSSKKPSPKSDVKPQKSVKAMVTQLKQASVKISKKTDSQKIKPNAKAAAANQKGKVAAATGTALKKPQTAFAIFQTQMQTQMKSMSKFNSLTSAEKTKVISESWGKISEKQQQGYTDQAIAQKKAYEKKMKKLGDQPVPSVTAKSATARKSPQKQPKVVAEKRASSEKSKSPEKSKTQQKPDICRPKKTQTAYMFFGNANYKTQKLQNPDLKVTEVMKINGEAWNKMTEEQKKPYVKLQQEDAVRHEKEMKEFNELGYYTNADGIKSTFMTRKHKVQEFEKGTVMPKKEASKGQTGVTAAVRAKKCGEQWNAFSEKQKQKYELLNKQDNERYTKQMTDLRKNGFFTNEDGVKSTDMVQKVKRVKKQ